MPKGIFEDTDFLQMHQQILIDNNFSSVGLLERNTVKVSQYHVEKMRAIIAFKNSMHSQWAWKEPRTCLFLPQYRQLLPEAKYLVIYRDVQEVVNSLIKKRFFKKL